MTWNPDLYKKAWDFAALAHKGQTYGGSEEGVHVEYISHIGSVAMEVISGLEGAPDCDADLAIQCALLHDVIEDTDWTYEQVLEKFGKSVADGVQALSKDTSLPTKREQMEDSLRRIKEQPKEVWMVKLADRITNLYSSPYYWNHKKQLKYQEEARLIYDALHECNPKLAKRLAKKIEAYV
mgnify:CR=1 FL=1